MSSKICLLVITLLVSCYGNPATPTETLSQPSPAEEETPVKVASAASSIPSVPEPKPVNEGPRGARSYIDNDVQSSSQFEESLIRKLNSKCTQRDSSSCAMLKLVTYMNRLLKKANIEVADNIEITQTASIVQVQGAEVPRLLTNEPEETQLAELLTGKLMQFLRSRSLRLRLLPTTDVIVTSNPDGDGNLNLGMAMESVKETETGRGKNKNMGGLLAAVVMKMGMLGALAFKGLALLVGKALLVSKIALLLAVVLGLKKLFSQQKHVTYEVVAQPHHSHSHVEHVEHGHSGGGGGGGSGGHDSYSSGWGRSIGVSPVGKGDGQDLAYGSYAPK